MWSTTPLLIRTLATAVVVVSWASTRLTSSLERVGSRWRFSEGLLGILTALGANAAGTYTAVTAILTGHHDVGVGRVRSAIGLGDRWGASPAVVGTLVVAASTSVPNVVAAVTLARGGRGAAVLSEAFDSNHLNILVGLGLPALLLGFPAPGDRTLFAVFWLLGRKAIAVLAASRRGGLDRLGGAVLVGLYVAFAAVILLGM